MGKQFYSFSYTILLWRWSNSLSASQSHDHYKVLRYTPAKICGCKNIASIATVETVCQFLRETSISIRPNTSYSWAFILEWWKLVFKNTKTCTWMFIAALFIIIAKNQNDLWCPSVINCQSSWDTSILWSTTQQEKRRNFDRHTILGVSPGNYAEWKRCPRLHTV